MLQFSSGSELKQHTKLNKLVLFAESSFSAFILPRLSGWKVKWHEITEVGGFPADGWLAVSPARRALLTKCHPSTFCESVADPCGRFLVHFGILASMVLLIAVRLRLPSVFCGWVGYDLMVHLTKTPDSKQQHIQIYIWKRETANALVHLLALQQGCCGWSE